jgi:hypothetical protein
VAVKVAWLGRVVVFFFWGGAAKAHGWLQAQGEGCQEDTPLPHTPTPHPPPPPSGGAAQHRNAQRTADVQLALARQTHVMTLRMRCFLASAMRSSRSSAAWSGGGAAREDGNS